MKKIGLSIDYSDICKDYNTSYLDRDNLDPATKKCMKQVLLWSEDFLVELLDNYGSKLHHLSSDVPVSIDKVSSKRFLFYSLEKEITLQSYVIQKDYKQYESLSAWEAETSDTILIQNDEDGGCVYVFFNEDSTVKEWISTKLKDFSLEDAVFEAR
ncbi:hypothetical protein JHD50_02260 [Sulfurimonas sp. MAG313]|nr:hypothetical protein [Sulfurimonas sp. MAG313]MDF1880135.1 hypothetical protein [Sulfurimonas sp. MAG313]